MMLTRINEAVYRIKRHLRKNCTRGPTSNMTTRNKQLWGGSFVVGAEREAVDPRLIACTRLSFDGKTETSSLMYFSKQRSVVTEGYGCSDTTRILLKGATPSMLKVLG
jgi:hypothetical protein